VVLSRRWDLWDKVKQTCLEQCFALPSWRGNCHSEHERVLASAPRDRAIYRQLHEQGHLLCDRSSNNWRPGHRLEWKRVRSFDPILVTVGVQRTSLGGAEFYTMLVDKQQDSEPSEETAALQHDVESQQTMSLPNGTFRPIPDNTPSSFPVNTVRDSTRATFETLPNYGFNPPEALPSR